MATQDDIPSNPASMHASPSANTLTEAHLAKLSAAAVPRNLYPAGPLSVADSSLTLLASQPPSPLSTPPIKKEKDVSPLDQAGAVLVVEQPASSSESDLESQNESVNKPKDDVAAWMQVASGFLFSCIAWGTLSMFGIYSFYYTETLGLNANAVSWIGSIQTFLTYLTSTASGRLSDAGYAVHTGAVGTVLVLAGGVWMSFCKSAGTFMASQAVCMGIGLGLLSTPALPSISAYFAPGTSRGHLRSVALSLSTIGSSVGGAVLPAIVQYLLPVVGFGWAVRCSALVVLVVCIAAVMLLRKPASMSTVSTSSSASSSPSPSRRSMSRTCNQLADWSALREMPFVLFLVSTFFMYWSLYFGFYYINTYAEKVIGFSNNQATVLLILSTVTGIPTRIASSLIATYCISALDCLVIFTATMGITLICWTAVGTSAVGMYIFVVMFGLSNGATQGVWIGALADLMPSEPVSQLASQPTLSPSQPSKTEAIVTVSASPAPAPASPGQSRIGARFGIACTVSAVATLAGPPTAAALIQKSGTGYLASDYRGAIIWAGAVVIVSAAVVEAARVRVLGWRLRAGMVKK